MRLLFQMMALLCFCNCVIAQSADQLSAQESFLNFKKKTFLDSIKAIDDALDLIKNQRVLIAYKAASLNLNKRYFATVTGDNAKISSEALSGHLTSIKKGEIVELLDMESGKIKVYANQAIGFLWRDDLVPNKDLEEFRQQVEQRKLYEKAVVIDKEIRIRKRFDSIKIAARDSAMFIVRVLQGPKTFAEVLHGPRIVTVANHEPLKIISFYGAADDYAVKVKNINNGKILFASRFDLEKSEDLNSHINDEVIRSSNRNASPGRSQSSYSSPQFSGSSQCTGTTQKGARCRRMTTSASGRCYQH